MPLKNWSTDVVGIWGVLRDEATERINNYSLLETVTGNFNSLMSQKDCLFFLSPDGSPKEAKDRESCSMPGGAARARGPKPQNFPVKFPVSREMGYGERIARDCQHHQECLSILISLYYRRNLPRSLQRLALRAHDGPRRGLSAC